MKEDFKMETTKEAAIIGALNDMFRTYEARDLDAALSYFAPSATVSLFGTGADERRVGLDEVRYQMERDFAQSEGISFNLDWSLVGISGSVAWVASDITIAFKVSGQPEMAFPARLSVVLQDYDGRWLAEHFHMSVAAASQEEGQSF
jgi:ketosteroid isomerase-like protein